jgi:hypothetical protein
VAFAQKAIQFLNERLPDPQLEGKLGLRNIWDAAFEHPEPRRWLVSRSWRPEFAPAVRRVGRDLLGGRGDEQAAVWGAYILTCLGEQEDVAALVAALDRAIARARDLPRVERNYPRPRGACQELMRAVRMMVERGVEVPPEPRSAGEAILFAVAVGTRKDFRPTGWEATCAALLLHPMPYVREVMLENMPLPLAPPLRRLMPRLLADGNVDAQIAACRVAEKARAPELRGPILRVLATGREKWLLRAADDAAGSLASRLEYMEVWVSRLDEEGMTAECLRNLAMDLLVDIGSRLPTAKKLDAAAGRKCKAAWQRFLREHAGELRTGRQFVPGDPAVPLADLFPKFSFNTKSGTQHGAKPAADQSHRHRHRMIEVFYLAAGGSLRISPLFTSGPPARTVPPVPSPTSLPSADSVSANSVPTASSSPDSSLPSAAFHTARKPLFCGAPPALRR